MFLNNVLYVLDNFLIFYAAIHLEMPVPSQGHYGVHSFHRVPGENHRLVASNWQTLSHNIVSSTPSLRRVQTHNVSGDRHWLHR